jgi:hypothetical protein
MRFGSVSSDDDDRWCGDVRLADRHDDDPSAADMRRRHRPSLYIAVVLIQALTRDGFDLTRHPARLLSNGDVGWVQITSGG